jgi:hypothetical protein
MVSKNSKKTSKPAQVIFQKKEKPKKEFLYFEVTSQNYTKVKEQQDLSYFIDDKGRELVIDEILKRHGKLYFKCKNN